MRAMLDAQRAALVIQDLQNDAISEGGAFGSTGAAAHAKSQNVVESGAHELRQNAPLFASVREANANVRGSWGAAPVDGLAPEPGDFTIEKLRMNAFYGTKLDTLLRGLDVSTLVLTGAWTNMSIEHTARHAADAGYRVVVASDGTSTLNAEWQAAALGYALTHVATIATCTDIASALETWN